MIRSLIFAFSMYSRIPVPRISYDGSEKKYAMAFFPLVGLVTGALGYALVRVSYAVGLSPVFITGLFLALPIWITGGIHLDGFMDTSDAVSSFADREKRLAILSDPHIGAFAVIHAIALTAVYAASLYEIFEGKDDSLILCLSLSFILSRIISAFSVLTLKSAKKGSVDEIKKASANLPSMAVLGVLFLAVSAALIIISIPYAAAIMVFSAALLLFYRISSYRVFGGITGDTSGWLLSVLECGMALILAVAGHLL